MVDGRLVAVPASVYDVPLSVVCVGISVVDVDSVDGADTENKIVFPGEATGDVLEWLASVDVPAEV